MNMAGLVLGASPSLIWWRSDIIIVVNDGRSRCSGFWHAVGGGKGMGGSCIVSGSQM